MEKITKKEKSENSKIESYSNYKGNPMVRITGGTAGNGFYLSRKKISAILENAKELEKFANGEMDSDIKELKDDEILKV